MKIPRYKPKFTQHMVILFAVIIAMLNLSANTLTVHAEDFSGFISEIMADSKGTSGGGGTNKTTNGVMYTRTGYLCYMLTVDGQTVPGTNAKAFKSPGYNGIPDSGWRCKSRKGGYSATGWEGTAPWNCTPWAEGGSPTHEPDIKAWMTKVEKADTANGILFVADNWGNEIAKRFENDELILVIETIMNFQWSTSGSSSGGMTMADAKQRANALLEGYSDTRLVNLAKKYGLEGLANAYETKNKELKELEDELDELEKELIKLELSHDKIRINKVNRDIAKKKAEIEEQKKQVDKKEDSMESIANRIRNSSRIIEALTDAILDANSDNEDSGNGTVLHGKPVIGTLPCLLDYKSSLNLTSTRLDSYTNKVACFAEMIEQGKAGEKAGFKPWTGSTGSKISDADVKTYGLAMGVYTAHDMPSTGTGTHTWDSDKNPQGTGAEDKAPEPPSTSLPTERKFTIIKSYRVKDKTTGVLEDRGTFKRTQTVAAIRIEDEPLNTTDKNYKVIAWKQSSSDQPPSLTSLNWETKVPQLISNSIV